MIFQYLYKPFYVIRQNKANFTIWFLSTILGGNLGLASNVLIRKYINNISLIDSIVLDYHSGSFYIFSIVLLASSVGNVLIDFLSKRNTDFKSLKVVWLGLTFLLSLLCSLAYSVYICAQTPQINNDVSGDVLQLILFLLSIVFSTYSFCLVLMDANDSAFASISDRYERQEEKKIQEISEKVSSITNDGNGLKL